MGIYNFDIVILGGGPAGLSAGIYSARSNASTAILDITMFGGQPSNYLELENYPGFPLIEGFDLMGKFEEHADKFNVQKYPMIEIKKIDLTSNPKIIETIDNTFYAKSVIIACGAQAKKLGVKGELEYIGRGVSYCAVCDGAFYKDKIVTVVGGGNAAVEEALYLTKFAKKVYIVHRRNEFRADKIIQERAFKSNKLEFIFDNEVLEIKGNDTVNSIILKNVQNDNITNLKTDGVFPYIGFTPNIKGISGQVEQDHNGFIITDSTMQTSIQGVFAAGDIRNTPLRQVITAASDGAISAVYASKYIESLTKNNQISRV